MSDTGPRIDYSRISNPRVSSLLKAEAIVWAAKSVFLLRGFERATMDEIAMAAGTTKRTVYHHFGSKEALFSAVIELGRQLFHAKLKTPAVYSEEPIEALTCFFARFLELMTSDHGIALQRLVLAEADRQPQVAQNLHRSTFSLAETLLGDYLVEHGRTSSIPLLQQVIGAHYLQALFGMVPPIVGSPDGDRLSPDIDLAPIRLTVERYWRLSN